MKSNIFIDGEAGQGPHFLAKFIGEILAKHGYYSFISREYGSFIRGGINSNQITFSSEPIYSNSSEKGMEIHLEKEKDKSNSFFAGQIAKKFGIDFAIVEEVFREYSNFDENIKNAKEAYNKTKTEIPLPKLKNKISIMDGAQAISKGAILSGLDTYFAYPMTPATTLMNELAKKQFENNYFVFEMEGEIAVIQAALGASATGAKSMIGSAGGGFDLMTEALSMAGQAEIPIVIYLAQRVGPGTGVATKTSQADLNLSLNAGHGEFLRLVLAPGDAIECQELTNQAFYLSQKYKIPSIILSDKHLAESLYSTTEKAKIIKSEKSMQLKKYTSYEHTEDGLATSKAEIIIENADRRLEKAKQIAKEANKFETYKIYGKKDSRNLILFWGSTKGAILDAIKSIKNPEIKAIQIIYLEPFPEKIKSELEKAKNIIVVENNSTSQLSQLIANKTGIMIEDKNKILRYDGRPFLSDELETEIKRRLK